ncbi:PREDICTED: protein TOC75-3, chloroplastic-like isoform X2 [Fragaria vesca subsp. vesca]|uniref:protein TOC75-3, chloroplastic-like isoform X2 n=1 Tax=Fragaria vesca subsp. vesca TaxID=101020 RepID=UPI0002C31A3E|nr:PREDICTED: protein TOC75-3, chloroplastic-like isoform X2 [Fragaria vesca subsp. vesca]
MLAVAPTTTYLTVPTTLRRPSSAPKLPYLPSVANTRARRRQLAQCRVSCSSSSSSSSPLSLNPNPSSSHNLLQNLAKILAGATTVTLVLNLSKSPAFNGRGGSSGGGGGGGGHGSNGGGGGFWRRLLGLHAAIADEPNDESWDSHGLPANIVVQLSRLSGFKKYKASEIVLFDRRQRSAVGADDPFYMYLTLRPGGVYTKAELQSELESLANSRMFDKVELEGKTNRDGTLAVSVSFTESIWLAADRFRCINVGLMGQVKPIEMDPDMTDREKLQQLRNQDREYKRRMEKARPCMMPASVQREVVQMVREHGKVTSRLLQKVRDRVQKWYQDEGYVWASVVNFGNLNTKEIVCEVMEGDITKLVVQFKDKLGNVVEGKTQGLVVKRELPKQLRPGNVFNIEAGKQALRNLNSLGLFSNIEVNPVADEKNEGGVIVEINLKEHEHKTADVSTEWNIVCGHGGYPTLASLLPGGTVTFQHQNLNGLNRSLIGSVKTNNLFNPQDNLEFKLEYVHPYLDGVDNPRDRTLRVSCFNDQKPSPVFTGGPGDDEVPPVMVDRAGIKANITENLSRQSKFTYGLVMEEITTRDEQNHILSNGQRVLPSGGVSEDGPPTTLSGTGIDHVAFLQSNITRDNTKFVNGTLVGQRNVFQVDQGLGIGSKFPFFNRHQLSLTRFFQLKEVEEGAGKPPPPVLVLHGHYGVCVGDLPSYDAFTLGGPYSVRGYNMGEIGAARQILELAAELRIPVKGKNVYAFVEHGNDLGSSKDVKGNPTEVYRRVGHGSSYGVGVKLGQVRVEYAVDHNSGTGSTFIRFGERF